MDLNEVSGSALASCSHSWVVSGQQAETCTQKPGNTAIREAMAPSRQHTCAGQRRTHHIWGGEASLLSFLASMWHGTCAEMFQAFQLWHGN